MNLSEFDDYTLQAITKEGLDLNEGRAAKKYLEEVSLFVFVAK